MVEFKTESIDEDAVLREVWDTSNIEAKTELNDIQIENVNKLLTLGEVFGSQVLLTHTKTFMTLQKSRQRQSMKEFVDVVRAKRDDFVGKGKGFFSSMLG